jgi:tetratricopeptide (TPR) repeat protein
MAAANSSDSASRYASVEIAMLWQQWGEALIFGQAALTIAPDSAQAEGVRVALSFIKARSEGDTQGAEAAYQAARDVLNDRPDDPAAGLVAIHWHLDSDDPEQARPFIDAGIARSPGYFAFQPLKLRMLQGLGDDDAVGRQMMEMHRLFPQQSDVAHWLFDWLDGRGLYDEADTLLEETAGDDLGRRKYVDYLVDSLGPEEAQNRLLTRITEHAGTATAAQYQILLAGVTIDLGNPELAVEQLRSAMEDSLLSDKSGARIMLARALNEAGEIEAAQEEVTDILASDPANSDALALRGSWRIDDGDLDGAVSDLRAALSERPDDQQLHALLSEVYLKKGSPSLAVQQLVLAFERSGSSVDSAVRLVDLLMEQNKFVVAQTVLGLSMAKNPESVRLWRRAAVVLSRTGDRAAAEDYVRRLRELGTEEALTAAKEAEAEIQRP